MYQSHPYGLVEYGCIEIYLMSTHLKLHDSKIIIFYPLHLFISSVLFIYSCSTKYGRVQWLGKNIRYSLNFKHIKTPPHHDLAG